MSSEAILPFWTGLLSPSRIQPAYPPRELQAATNPFAGTGKLDHELIDKTVVTGRAGAGPLRFESGHRQFVGRMWTVALLSR